MTNATTTQGVIPFLPRPVKRLGRRLLSTLEVFSSFFLSRRPFGCSVHDLLFARKMSRETWAVHQGVLRHSEQSRTFPGSALFRRNIHRLEKGLVLAKPGRVFGLDFIDETVKLYRENAARKDVSEDREFDWASDVLQRYFDTHVAGNVPHSMEGLRAQFESARKTAEVVCGGVRVPHLRDSGEPPVATQAFLALCRRRRSTRDFSDRPVARETIDEALQAARAAPSACNRQPFVFRIADEPAQVRSLATLPMGTAGFAHKIPVFVVLVGQLRCFSDPRDRHLIYVDGALAAMSFSLALETLGLASCFLNWPDIEERERAMAKALRLAPDERVVVCMAVGYPAVQAMVAHSERKPLESIRKYES